MATVVSFFHSTSSSCQTELCGHGFLKSCLTSFWAANTTHLTHTVRCPVWPEARHSSASHDILLFPCRDLRSHMLARFNSVPCWQCACALAETESVYKWAGNRYRKRERAQSGINVSFSESKWTTMWKSFRPIHSREYCCWKDTSNRAGKQREPRSLHCSDLTVIDSGLVFDVDLDQCTEVKLSLFDQDFDLSSTFWHLS